MLKNYKKRPRSAVGVWRGVFALSSNPPPGRVRNRPPRGFWERLIPWGRVPHIRQSHKSLKWVVVSEAGGNAPASTRRFYGLVFAWVPFFFFFFVGSPAYFRGKIVRAEISLKTPYVESNVRVGFSLWMLWDDVPGAI